MTRIVLVSCGKSKATSPAPARDLYTSVLFRKSRAHAEAMVAAGEADAWFILSAKHGLLEPTTIVEPYDERVPGGSVPMGIWGKRVVEHLRARFADQAELIILAGVCYALPIRERVASFGWTVVEPLQGLEVGERLHWLNEQAQLRAWAATIPETCTWKTRRCGVCGAGPQGVSGEPLRCSEHASYPEVPTDLESVGDGTFRQRQLIQADLPPEQRDWPYELIRV